MFCSLISKFVRKPLVNVLPSSQTMDFFLPFSFLPSFFSDQSVQICNIALPLSSLSSNTSLSIKLQFRPLPPLPSAARLIQILFVILYATFPEGKKASFSHDMQKMPSYATHPKITLNRERRFISLSSAAASPTTKEEEKKMIIIIVLSSLKKKGEAPIIISRLRNQEKIVFSSSFSSLFRT